MAMPTLPSPALPSYYETAEKPLDYKYYLFLLKRNLNLLVTFLVMGITLASIYVSRLPDRYHATTQILLDRPIGNMQPTTPTIMSDIWQEDYYVTQKEIMTGSTVLRQVVDELKLMDYFRVSEMDEAVNRLKGYLKVDRIRGSRLFNITAMTSDPVFSMNLANAVARAYIRKNFEDQLYFSKEILAWLPKEGEETITVQDPFGKVKQLTREELMETLPSIQTDPTIRALEEKKTFLEAELTTMLNQFREKHPAVIKARASLKFLEESIEAERKRVVESMKQQAAGKLQVSNARIVEEAELPAFPSGPQRIKLVATMVGFEMLAFFIFVLVWDYFDDTIRSPDDFTRKGIHLAFLGPVPMIKQDEVPAEERFLITHYQPRSSAAESFRYLRVAINFSAPAETLRNLVLTSSLPSEGKSFISHNLAISLAQDGNRTLLIDADLRRPVAQKIYQIENHAGLSNFLTSDIAAETVVRPTFIENLSVILSGPASPNPAEILASPRMGELLKAVREQFDRIIIDAPPLTGMGDSLILGSLTTHVIFIIRAAKTPSEIIRKSTEILEKSGVRIIGAVLNQVDIEKERYGGYYKYYYQSYTRYYGKTSHEPKKS